MRPIEVVPIFLEVLETHTDRLTQAERFRFFAKVYKRLGEGMRKYGRPFTIFDGRDSLLDAWEEACDGAQYLTKAYLEGKLTNPQLIHDQTRLMIAIEREMNGRTETDHEARGGPSHLPAQPGEDHRPVRQGQARRNERVVSKAFHDVL